MRKVWMVLVAAVGLLLVSAGGALAQATQTTSGDPTGQLQDSAQNVGQGSGTMATGLAQAYNALVDSGLGWVVGAFILFIFFRFLTRAAR